MLVDLIVVARCGFANDCRGVSCRCHCPAALPQEEAARCGALFVGRM